MHFNILNLFSKKTFLKARPKVPKSVLMQTSLLLLRRLLPVAWLALGVSSCLKGPGFMKQGPQEQEKQPATATEELKKVLVPTVDLGDGSVQGALSATSQDIQVLQASDDSVVAGSLAEFPPGSVAIDTQMTIGPGVAIDTEENLNELKLDTSVLASASSVVIASTVALDTNSDFTMQIPVPQHSGLRLVDLLDNLVVIYKVKKSSANGAEFTGLLTRSELEIVGNFVRFTTSYFGTFQAIITKTPVVEKKEVAVKPTPKFKNVYYVKGFASSTFGDDGGQRADGFQGVFHKFKPAVVKADAKSKLSTGFVTKRKQEVTEP
jgi:hypothetical protein